MEHTLCFHSELYSVEAVAEAVAAFAGRADVAVESFGPHQRVTLRGDDSARLRQVGHELANYALAVVAARAAAPAPAKPVTPEPHDA